MKNIDKMKTMNSEELARFIVTSGAGCGMCVFEYKSIDCLHHDCSLGIRFYLESEAEQ